MEKNEESHDIDDLNFHLKKWVKRSKESIKSNLRRVYRNNKKDKSMKFLKNPHTYYRENQQNQKLVPWKDL